MYATDGEALDDERPLRPPPRPMMTPMTKTSHPPGGIHDDETRANPKASRIEETSGTDILEELSVRDLRQLVRYVLRITDQNEACHQMIRSEMHRLAFNNNNNVDDESCSSSESSVPFTEASTPTMRSSRPLRSLVDSPTLEPPLLKRSRSHDDDFVEEPVLRVRNNSATDLMSSPYPNHSEPLSQSRTKEQQQQSSSSMAASTDGLTKRHQLVVLCSRTPATPKEVTDQDLAMELCRNLGIIPHVILSEAATIATVTNPEEQVLLDAIQMAQNRNSNNKSTTFPQFFVRTLFADTAQFVSGENNNTTSKRIMAAIEYKGDYDTMEALCRSGAFHAQSLSVTDDENDVLDSTATTDNNGGNGTSLTDNDRQRLEQLIRETDELRRKLNIEMGPAEETTMATKTTTEKERPGYASIGELNAPPMLRHQEKPQHSPMSSRSASPISNKHESGSTKHTGSSNQSTSTLGTKDFNESIQLSSFPAETTSSYSHLDGLNQPRASASSHGSSMFGEMSLGDDLRMIFDMEEPTTTTTTTNHPQHQHNASVESGEDHSRGETISTMTPMPTGVAMIPTITEDEEEEEDDEEEDDYEDEEEDEPVVVANNKTGSSSFSEKTTLPPKETVKRETVTLRRAQKEPPGALVAANAKASDPSGYLGRARGSLKSPSSHHHDSEVSVPTQKPKSKIINPYYALDTYSGGKGFEEEDPLPEEAPPNTLDSSPGVTTAHHDRQKTPNNQGSAPYDEVLDRRDRSWERYFVGVHACYLVFHNRDDELQIYYSESPMAYAVGVWTSPNIRAFKEAQGLSECEMIGTCASNVTMDHKNYYQGWCQFIKAAKNMDATVTVLEGLGVPVDFFVYQCDTRSTIQVEDSFETRSADAVACVPKDCGFPTEGLVGKKWGKAAKKLGALALFKSLSTKHSSRNTTTITEETTEEVMTVCTSPEETTEDANTVFTSQDESPSHATTDETHGPTSDEHLTTRSEQSPAQVETEEELPSATIDQNVEENTSVQAPQDEAEPEVPASLSIQDEAEPEVPASLSMQLPCPQEGACYLVYNPDSSGQLVEHYSRSPINFAIGRWIPAPGKRIAGFKFKRNVGRNVLIGSCAAGVQGRKNYSSGWCQFVRSAKVMGGEVVLWNPSLGHKGLKVDVCLYYADARAHHQTVRMEEGTAYTTDNLLAVACLPKGTPFFEDMTVDLLMWLAEGSKHGYSTKL